MSRPHRNAMMGALEAIKKIGPRVTNAEIMVATGIRPNSISSALNNLFAAGYLTKLGERHTRRLILTDAGKEALNPTPAKERTCRMCMKPFASEGAGNWICSTCRESEEWKSGYDPEHFTVLGGR